MLGKSTFFIISLVSFLYGKPLQNKLKLNLNEFWPTDFQKKLVLGWIFPNFVSFAFLIEVCERRATHFTGSWILGEHDACQETDVIFLFCSKKSRSTVSVKLYSNILKSPKTLNLGYRMQWLSNGFISLYLMVMRSVMGSCIYSS